VLVSPSKSVTPKAAGSGSKRKKTASDDENTADEDDKTYKPPKRKAGVSDSDADRSPSPTEIVDSNDEEILEDTDKGKVIVNI